MLRLRSVIVQQLSARCFTGRFYNTAVRGRASYFYPKSRSRPSSAIPPSRLPGACRHMSSISSLNNNDVQKRVEDISDKFKEAMELLEDARGSIGTVYFSEDMNDAENAIQEVLSEYDNLMKEMDEDQRRSVVRTIGLKIEELKAQVQMLKDSLKD